MVIAPGHCHIFEFRIPSAFNRYSGSLHNPMDFEKFGNFLTFYAKMVATWLLQGINDIAGQSPLYLVLSVTSVRVIHTILHAKLLIQDLNVMKLDEMIFFNLMVAESYDLNVKRFSETIDIIHLSTKGI